MGQETGRHHEKVGRITADTPPSKKSVYGLFFMILFNGASTALQTANLIVLRRLKNEIFLLMSNLISVIVSSFFGAKV